MNNLACLFKQSNTVQMIKQYFCGCKIYKSQNVSILSFVFFKLTSLLYCCNLFSSWIRRYKISVSLCKEFGGRKDGYLLNTGIIQHRKKYITFLPFRTLLLLASVAFFESANRKVNTYCLLIYSVPETKACNIIPVFTFHMHS